MADPVTWAAIAASAFSAYKGGQVASAAAESQANVDEYNAKVSEIQVGQTNRATSAQQDEQRQRARAQIGNQLAVGAESGNALNTDLLRQSIFGMESDSTAITYQGALQASGLNATASLQRANAATSRTAASNASTAGYLNAAGSVLGGAAKYNQAKKGLN